MSENLLKLICDSFHPTDVIIVHPNEFFSVEKVCEKKHHLTIKVVCFCPIFKLGIQATASPKKTEGGGGGGLVFRLISLNSLYAELFYQKGGLNTHQS